MSKFATREGMARSCQVAGIATVLLGCLGLTYMTASLYLGDVCPGGGCNFIGFPIFYVLFGFSILLGMTSILLSWSLLHPSDGSPPPMSRIAAILGVFYVVIGTLLFWILAPIVIAIVFFIYRQGFSPGARLTRYSWLVRFRYILIVPMSVFLALTAASLVYMDSSDVAIPGLAFAGPQAAALTTLLVGLSRIAQDDRSSVSAP